MTTYTKKLRRKHSDAHALNRRSPLEIHQYTTYILSYKAYLYTRKTLLLRIEPSVPPSEEDVGIEEGRLETVYKLLRRYLSDECRDLVPKDLLIVLLLYKLGRVDQQAVVVECCKHLESLVFNSTSSSVPVGYEYVLPSTTANDAYTAYSAAPAPSSSSSLGSVGKREASDESDTGVEGYESLTGQWRIFNILITCLGLLSSMMPFNAPLDTSSDLHRYLLGANGPSGNTAPADIGSNLETSAITELFKKRCEWWCGSMLSSFNLGECVGYITSYESDLMLSDSMRALLQERDIEWIHSHFGNLFWLDKVAYEGADHVQSTHASSHPPTPVAALSQPAATWYNINGHDPDGENDEDDDDGDSSIGSADGSKANSLTDSSNPSDDSDSDGTDEDEINYGDRRLSLKKSNSSKSNRPATTSSLKASSGPSVKSKSSARSPDLSTSDHVDQALLALIRGDLRTSLWISNFLYHGSLDPTDVGDRGSLTASFASLYSRSRRSFPAFRTALWPSDARRDLWHLHAEKYIFTYLGQRLLELLTFQIIIYAHLQGPDSLFVVRGVQCLMEHAMYDSLVHIKDEEDEANCDTKDTGKDEEGGKGSRSQRRKGKKRKVPLTEPIKSRRERKYALDTSKIGPAHTCLCILTVYNINIQRTIYLASICAKRNINILESNVPIYTVEGKETEEAKGHNSDKRYASSMKNISNNTYIPHF